MHLFSCLLNLKYDFSPLEYNRTLEAGEVRPKVVQSRAQMDHFETGLQCFVPGILHAILGRVVDLSDFEYPQP